MRKVLIVLTAFISVNCIASDTTIFVSIGDTLIISNKNSQPIIQDTCNRLPIIFLCGQSNMEGGDRFSATPDSFAAPISGAYVFYKPDSTSANNGTIQTFDADINNNTFEPAERVGPEAGIAHYVTQAGKKIGIVKYARRGSQLVNYSNNIQGVWQTNGTHYPLQYKIFINNYAKPSFDAFKAAGYNPYIAAFVWCQGETDAGNATGANLYEQKLKLLIDTFKYDMRSRDPGVDTMHVIITRIHNHAGQNYMNQIRTAQANVANSFGVRGNLIDSDQWPIIADNLHWTRVAQCTMHGKAIADILLTFLQQ